MSVSFPVFSGRSMVSLFVVLSALFFGLFASVPVSAASGGVTTLSGVSGKVGLGDSGVLDFDYADYKIDDDRLTGKTINGTDHVIIDDVGNMGTDASSSAYAWNPQAGWIDFAWCYGGSCTGVGQPQVDMATGYWSGYLWNENIGWIQLDWSCGGCGMANRPHIDFSTGTLSGYAWNDKIGWISFGGAVATTIVTETTVIPIFEITPDPLMTAKNDAPLADGTGEYLISVYFYEPGVGVLDVNETDYKLDIKPIVTGDSELCFNQVSRSCVKDADPNNNTEAIYYPVTTYYDTVSETWRFTVRSYAPTSNANGYDADADGNIDYYYDVDPNDPAGIERSDSVNRFAIGGIDLMVAPVSTAPELVWDKSDPLYNLNDDDGSTAYEFSFAPAVEVANLERVQSSSVYTAYISAAASVEQEFRGLVVNWSSDAAFAARDFNVQSTLGVDTAVTTGVDPYKFLFDNKPDYTGDNLYTYQMTGTDPEDEEVVVSTYDLTLPGTSTPGDVTYLNDFDSASARAVYVSSARNFKPLSGGSLSVIPEAGMIVPGPTTITALAPEAPRYETQVYYDLMPSGYTAGCCTIRYYSNYLPQSGSAGTKEDVTISGSITSVTGEKTEISENSGGEVVVLGDISTLSIRNELFKRFSEMVKGVTADEDGTELWDGRLVYYNGVNISDDDVANAHPDAEVVVVWGGNIFLTNNSPSTAGSKGYVAFKNSADKGGIVYIDAEITFLENIHIFAERSVFSYFAGLSFTSDGRPAWGSVEYRSDILKNQLYFKGNIVSGENTIYGASVSPYVLGDGSTTTNELEALDYDLNELRQFSMCWIQVDILGSPQDTANDTDTSPYESDGVTPDSDDIETCYGAIRSASLDVNDNTPVYFDYTPPPSDLPLLGGSQSGAINVFD